MKQRDPKVLGFRRLAVGAAVSIWLGLILLAVGLVFSCSSPSPRSVMAVAPGTGTAVMQAAIAAAGATDVPAATETATATATVTPTPTETATAVPSSTATATVVVTPPTATATPTETPVPTPTATPVRGRPVRLVAPSIGMDTTVIEVGWHVETIEGTKLAVWDVADYAAGWHKTSARPGDGGNIVISGHHNIAGEVFRYVVDLQVGADLVLYVEDRAEPYVYKVEEVLILPEKGQPLEVRRQNASYIDPTDDERITLVTCWPYNNNTHRVIVIAKPQ
ncbi:MAG: sortase [Anaerolineae bacterium]